MTSIDVKWRQDWSKSRHILTDQKKTSHWRLMTDDLNWSELWRQPDVYWLTCSTHLNCDVSLTSTDWRVELVWIVTSAWRLLIDVLNWSELWRQPDVYWLTCLTRFNCGIKQISTDCLSGLLTCSSSTTMHQITCIKTTVVYQSCWEHIQHLIIIHWLSVGESFCSFYVLLALSCGPAKNIHVEAT